MITRLRLRNFKVFRELEINLSPLNFLTGLNATGKSSLIQALLLLRQSNLHRAIEGKKGLVLKGGEVGIVDLGKGRDVYNIEGEGEFIEFEIDFDFQFGFQVSYSYQPQEDILPLLRKSNNGLSTSKLTSMALFSKRFCYLKAERLAPSHYYSANYSAVKQDGFIGYRGENTPLFIALNWQSAVPLSAVMHDKVKANNLASNLDAWLGEISPGAHVNSTYFQELDIVRLSYYFDNDIDYTDDFSPVNVGFGLTYLLPILVAILSAKKGDLLIVENPESHLHPRGQVKIGELLARAAGAGVQVIIESHSDHVFNGIRVALKKRLIDEQDASFLFFERGQSKSGTISNVRQPIVDQEGRVDEWPKGFFDEYANQLDSLL